MYSNTCAEELTVSCIGILIHELADEIDYAHTVNGSCDSNSLELWFTRSQIWALSFTKKALYIPRVLPWIGGVLLRKRDFPGKGASALRTVTEIYASWKVPGVVSS